MTGNRDDKAIRLSRRSFLVGSVAGGLTLAFGRAGSTARAAEQLAAGAFEPTVWFRIEPDGRTVIHIAKAEMGQHVGTALARVVAEELEADWDRVEIVHVDTDPGGKWGAMVTGGSWSVHTTFDQLSRAGAAGRTALLEAAAKKWGVAPEDCVARGGIIVANQNKTTFAELISEGPIDRTFSDAELAALELKDPSHRRLLGVDIPALDIPEKTTGAAVYGIDLTRENMVYARPVLPPVRYGSELLSFDDSKAKEVPGYVQTVTIEDPSGTCQGWLAVLAENTHAAFRAADKIEAQWKPGPGAEIGEADVVAEGRRLVGDDAGGVYWVKEGDAATAMSGAKKVVEGTYTTSTALHFQLEPVNALAYEEDGHWHIHAGNQWQTLIMPVVAKALEVGESDITIHQYYLGGGFGRRLWGDYLIPPALISKKIKRPVKMVFTRSDDAWLDCPRSASVQRVRIGLSADGSAVAYDHRAAAGWPTQAMGPSMLADGADGKGLADSFAIAGADHWYDIADQSVLTYRNEVAHKTFLPGYLRAVGPGWTTWAVESQLDEAAAAAGKDPVGFRLAMLGGKGRNAGKEPESVGGGRRLAGVLERAVELSDWAARGDLPEGTGLGVAICAGQERTMPTWVACVARVRVDSATGKIDVEKLTSVVDAGTIVHPDGAIAQMEGSLLWGLSLALHESTEIKDGVTAARNLDRYSPLRMHQVPELEIDFIDDGQKPSGLGEPGVCVVAPAIANAVYDAVGVRLRDLPMTPAALKAARSA